MCFSKPILFYSGISNEQAKNETYRLLSSTIGGWIVTPKVIFFDINETLLDMQAIKTGLASVLNGDETLVDLWFANYCITV